ncbi:hypothetical protein IQ273_05610 [Nodosilinea sp. LEGE 07298]|uniref:hypothetical protein n=1 Tax=Nodosilinea sp. LEGE 07298 TaxID=2777970 RepID=UPI00187FA2D6|nr:hypothetical protein [Nodosilinea sp. LEGE 07298]MBE9108892.1 hypothetical protein [Nodosilinea sp. LEGE 07298]
MSAPVAELTTEKVNAAIAIIFEVLGEPETDIHRQALQSFQQGDYQTVKRLSLENLNDFYCKALGYLGGALKLDSAKFSSSGEGEGKRTCLRSWVLSCPRLAEVIINSQELLWSSASA